MKTYSCFVIAVALLAIPCLQGCAPEGPAEGTVTGTITYKGSPLPLDPQPRIFFQSEGGEGGVANLDADGKYTMENLRHADYKVYFKPDYPFPPVPNPKELDIPEKYMSTETSGITFTLDESNAVFDFDITD